MWMVKILMFYSSGLMAILKNQMSMVLLIMLTCLFMSIFMLIMSTTHWFSLLLMLVYISGIMVLFMFMVSLTPNMKTTLKKKPIHMMFLLSSMILMSGKMNSESMKTSSYMEWSLMMMIMMIMVVAMMAYLPPLSINSFYSGMKSTK